MTSNIMPYIIATKSIYENVFFNSKIIKAIDTVINKFNIKFIIFIIFTQCIFILEEINYDKKNNSFSNKELINKYISVQ